MGNWQAIGASLLFASVIGMIVMEWMPLAVAAMLGALLLVVSNILTLDRSVGYIASNHTTLGLFLGVMVMIRALQPTQVFDYLATQIVILAQGKGNRLLLGIVAITTPICAVLPNATTVMLLAPLIPTLAQEIGVDFVPLLILMVVVANSAGLLTLVGDPATFIVGSSIKMTFIDYLQTLSFGGVLAVLVVIATLPFLFKKIWQTELSNPATLIRPKIKHPKTLGLGLIIVLLDTFSLL